MAKKLKFKIPKRIAGVKIPKAVRKGPVAGFLNSSGGQLILAQALVAAAGALAASRTDENSSVGEAVRHPVDAAKDIGRNLQREGADQAARLSFALREAARSFRAAMEQGPPAGDPSWTTDALDAQVDEPTAKKKSASRPTATPH